MTKRKPTKHQDDIRRNLRKNAEINDLQSPHDGIHTCSKRCSKPGCNRGLRDTIEEQDAQIQALKQDLLEQSAAARHLRMERIHDLNLIASLKEDNESLTGQVRQFEEHRDIAAGLIAGLEKDKAAADRATFDAIRTITELRAEFEAFMTTPTSRLLRAKQAENACLAIENGSLKEEVERLNDLANDPYRLSKGWRPIETAPKDGDHIIGWSEDFTSAGIFLWTCLHQWDDPKDVFGWVEAEGDWSVGYKITHWMPLPKPPAAKDGKPNA